MILRCLRRLLLGSEKSSGRLTFVEVRRITPYSRYCKYGEQELPSLPCARTVLSSRTAGWMFMFQERRTEGRQSNWRFKQHKRSSLVLASTSDGWHVEFVSLCEFVVLCNASHYVMGSGLSRGLLRTARGIWRPRRQRHFERLDRDR